VRRTTPGDVAREPTLDDEATAALRESCCIPATSADSFDGHLTLVDLVKDAVTGGGGPSRCGAVEPPGLVLDLDGDLG
jgi:hypothetical protein